MAGRTILRRTAYLLAALPLMAALAFAALQTPFAKRVLTGFIADRISDAQTQVTLAPAEGFVPFDMRLPFIRVADRQGEWLTVEDARVEWKLTSLFPLQVNVASLSAARIHVARAPAAPETPQKVEFRLPAAPKLPRIRMEKLSLPRIELEEAAAGKAAVLAAEGSFATFIDAQNPASSFSVRTLEGTPTTLDASAEGTGDALRLLLAFDEAEGGWVAGLFGLPDAPLALRAQGEGSLTNWRGTLLADAGAQRVLEAEFTSGGERENLSLSAQARVLAQAYSALKDDATLDFHALLKDERVLQLTELNLGTGERRLTLSGEYDINAERFGGRYRIVSGDLRDLAGVEGNVTLSGDMMAENGKLRINGSGAANIGEVKDIALTLNAERDGKELRLAPLDIKGDGISASLTARLEESAQALETQLELDVKEAGRFLPALGGDWAAKAQANGTLEQLAFSLDAKGQGAAGTPLAGGMTITAAGELKRQSEVHIERLRVDGRALTLAASGSATLNTPHVVKLALEAGAEDISLLAPMLRGAMSAKADINGLLDAPLGEIEATLTNDAQTLAVNAKFASAGPVFRLSSLTADATGVKLSASGQYDQASGKATGTLSLDARDLAGLSPFIAVPIDGRAEINAALRNDGGMTATGEAAGIRAGGVSLASATASLAAADWRNPQTWRAVLEADGVDAGGFVLDSVAASLVPGAEESAYRIALARKGADALALESEGRVSFALPDYRVQVASLKGEFERHPFILQQPFTFSHAKSGYAFSEAAFSIGEGAAAVSGALSPRKTEARLTFARLPLQLLAGERFSGLISGDASLTGTPARPKAQLDFEGEIGTALRAQTIRKQVKGRATLAAGKLSASLESEGINARASVPARFSLMPLASSIHEQAPLSGSLALNGRIGPWAALMLPESQELAADAQGEFTVSGTVRAPSLRGRLTLEDGRYNNALAGVELQNIEASVDANGNAIRLTSLTADDGGDGTLQAQGNALLTSPYALSLDATMTRLALLKSRAANGEVDGHIRLDGTAEAMNLKGDITAGPMEIRVPEGARADIPEIRIRNPQVLPGYVAEDESVSGPAMLALDIAIHAPARVFVRGRGLETEVRGDLRITGTAAEPAIDGSLRTVDGTFTLLDRELDITEGVLEFKGPMPPSPFLRMNAETTTQDITATLSLTGPVREPKLTLSSSPSLPQDEIMAHLLFGRDMRSITPFQAIQLAQAVQALRGGGGGVDLLGQARDMLGVDRLSVGGAEEGGVSVGAGKYISDRVYVGVEGGAGEDAGKVKTEIEITPRISVEAETGARANGGRVNWKYDY